MRPSTSVICLCSVALVSALPQTDAGTLKVMSKPATEAYRTEIELNENKIDYGTTNPGDMLESVLRPACKGNGCTLSPTEVKISVWNNDHSPTRDATLKIHAIGDYQADEADNFIDAIVGAARGAAQCEAKTYTVRPVRSSLSVGRLDFEEEAHEYTETFCKMSSYVKIYRYSGGGDENKHGSIEVNLEYEEEEGFNWCDLFDYASLIPKLDFFGTASSACNLAKDAIEG